MWVSEQKWRSRSSGRFPGLGDLRQPRQRVQVCRVVRSSYGTIPRSGDLTPLLVLRLRSGGASGRALLGRLRFLPSRPTRFSGAAFAAPGVWRSLPIVLAETFKAAAIARSLLSGLARRAIRAVGRRLLRSGPHPRSSAGFPALFSQPLIPSRSGLCLLVFLRRFGRLGKNTHLFSVTAGPTDAQLGGTRLVPIMSNPQLAGGRQPEGGKTGRAVFSVGWRHKKCEYLSVVAPKRG